jgi:hypothetical protein
LGETKQAGQQPFPVHPTFQILHTKIEEPSHVFLRPESQLDVLDEASTRDPHHFHLIQLDIIQSTGEYHEETGPVVFGVFVSTLSSESSLPSRPSSAIARWEVASGPVDLHSIFDEVSSKKGNAKTNVRSALKDKIVSL